MNLEALILEQIEGIFVESFSQMFHVDLGDREFSAASAQPLSPRLASPGALTHYDYSSS
jgi:hypothetical protein